MTNKMPVVGKRYKLKSGKNMIVRILPIITVVQEEIGGTIEYGVEVFNTIFEELPEDNSQETEECCPIETAEAAWNMSEVNETPNPVDLEKEEVNEIDRALEELKEILEEIKFPIGLNDFDKKVKKRSVIVRLRDMLLPTPSLSLKEAQNLVNALEAEQAKSKPETKVDNLLKAWEVEKKPFFKVREEGQFEGSPPTEETLARHEETIKRMKEELKEERKIDMKEAEKSAMSKLEPKIDMKEERVEPVSIWKDVSELPRSLNGAAVFYKRDRQTFIGKALTFNGSANNFYIMIRPDSNSDHFQNILGNKDIDKVCLVSDLINSFEQVQKDIEELKRKFTS